MLPTSNQAQDAAVTELRQLHSQIEQAKQELRDLHADINMRKRNAKAELNAVLSDTLEAVKRLKRIRAMEENARVDIANQRMKLQKDKTAFASEQRPGAQLSKL